jgi:hypothetical protein
MTMTIAEHGASDEAAEKCLDALLELYPESGPVVSQNSSTGHLTLAVALDATDPWAATNLGARILATSLNRAGLSVTPVLDVSVTMVEHHDSTENVRELIEA